MYTFFFLQEQNIEMIVEGGKPVGGAVVATHVWMCALHELGHRVVLSRREEDSRPILPNFHWIETKQIYHFKKGLPILRWIYYRIPRILKSLKEISPDFVVESIPAWTTVIINQLSKLSNSKHLVRVANDNMLDKRIKLTHGLFERLMILRGLKLCDYILTQNNFQFEKIRKKFPNQKVIKIHNPIILNANYTSEKTQVEGYIAWVANFRYQKNLKSLYEIAKFLPNEKFIVAGKPKQHSDPETLLYQEKLKELPNVEFRGVVSRGDILTFFRNSKFLLNTSRYEGFSNTFLEAMCTGTPVLTSPMVNPDGIISDFELGYVYQNHEDLSYFLTGLSDFEYTRLSKHCLLYVEQHHGHLTLARKLINFLEIK